MFKSILVFPLLLLVTSSWMAGTPIHNASAHGQASAPLAATDHYLELSITPSVAALGSLVTLRISYHNVGEPLTYFSASPAESVTTEPVISSPCFDCSVITFRTLTKGTVNFNAAASGEIFDDGCNCWVFTIVPDNGPAVLHIVDQAWTVFLPVTQR